jgi:uncharacterized protein YqcC (DUF446 family)
MISKVENFYQIQDSQTVFAKYNLLKNSPFIVIFKIMKKRLEAELISIAHRILKLKNKSELLQLHQETQKLYEALSVLRFVEENMEIVSPKMDVVAIEEKLAFVLDKKEYIDTEEKQLEDELASDFDIPVIKSDVPKEVEEKILEAPVAEKKLDFAPVFEITKEEEIATMPVFVEEPKQISFEDLLGHHYIETVFEKVGDEKKIEVETPVAVETLHINEFLEEKIVPKKETILENSKLITFALNDRLGFEKQLFAGSTEDMNRVVSQLSTLNSLQEAQRFLDDMVKPDYNNWEGKQDYEERFMEIIAKKF